MHFAIRPLHAAILVAVMATWSFNFVVMKWGVAQFPPLVFVALRSAVVALLLVPFVPRPRGQWRPILVLSFTFGSLHFALMFNGIVLTPASTTALLQQLQVPLAALLAALFLDERLGWRRLAGMALAFAGTIVVLGAPDLEAPWWSQALVLGASFCWALQAVQVKKLVGISTMTLTGWLALLSVPQLLLMSAVLEQGQLEALRAFSWHGVFIIAYNSIAVVLAGHGTYYWMLKRYDVNQVMPFTLLMPPFSVAFAVAFLDEPIGWGLLIGGLITVLGVGLIVVQRRARSPATPRRG